MAVTLKDIAKEAGVSYSTVSRVLNNKCFVDESKRELVLRIAEEMGYQPNTAAISLKLSKTYNLGLYFSTISKLSSPFVLHDVVRGAYSVTGTKYNLVVKGIDMHEPGTLNPSLYDGMVILTQRREDEPFIEEVIEKGVPIVAIGRAVYFDIPNVLADEAKGVEEAMNYLLNMGHRKIGVIEGNQGYDSTRSRHRGWVKAVRDAGQDPYEVEMEIGNYRYMSGYLAGKRLLKKSPTAILCFNDEMAFGAKAAIDEAGLSVPDDISLVGFDNWDMTSYSNMQLTTVERNMGDIAKEGTKLLMKLIETKEASVERIFLDTKLIIRESVKDLNARQEIHTRQQEGQWKN